MTPEKIVQTAILKYLRSLDTDEHHIFIERRQAGGFSYKMGIPDVYAVYKGKHIEIEVKRPGAQLRPMQEKWAEKMRNVGALYICATSVDDVKKLIENIV